MKTFALALAFVLAGCGGGVSGALQHALNGVASAVDPAYAVAVSGCEAREEQIETSVVSRDEYETRIASVRATCDRIFAAFEAVRRAHEGALLAVLALENGGELSDAIRAFDEVEAAWTALRAVWQ